MVDVDRILELKRRINEIADEVDEIATKCREAGSDKDLISLDNAWEHLDKADLLLGRLT